MIKCRDFDFTRVNVFNFEARIDMIISILKRFSGDLIDQLVKGLKSLKTMGLREILKQSKQYNFEIVLKNAGVYYMICFQYDFTIRVMGDTDSNMQTKYTHFVSLFAVDN